MYLFQLKYKHYVTGNGFYHARAARHSCINITSLGMVFIMRAQRVIPDIYYFVYLVRAERDIYLSDSWFQFLLQMAIRAHFQF